jgi:hypothetical protein
MIHDGKKRKLPFDPAEALAHLAGGPVMYFTADSPTMDCAPSKLRFLKLGWESTTVPLA